MKKQHSDGGASRPTNGIRSWIRDLLILAFALGAYYLLGLSLHPNSMALAWISTGLLVLVALAINRTPVRLVAIVLGSILFSVAAAETVLRVIPRGTTGETRYGHSYRNYQSKPDILGYRPNPSQTFAASKYGPGDRIVYQVTYTIGPDRLRVTPGEDSARDSTVLFFGGSFTFGEGVEDNQTTPYYFHEATNYRNRVLNFGFHGYGTHQMLRALELGLPDPLIEKDVAQAIYSMVPTHLERNAGESTWGFWDPEYRLTPEGRLQHHGRFAEPDNWFHSAVVQSEIARRTACLWARSEREKLELFRGILSRARLLLREQYGAPLMVLMWDDGSDRTASIVNLFEEEGVHYQLVSEILGDPDDEKFWIPNDGHPTAYAHRKIGYALAKTR